MLTNACSLTPKPPRFCVTRCAQTLTQKHSSFGAAEAGVISTWKTEFNEQI
jgi:hypothetical protein